MNIATLILLINLICSYPYNEFLVWIRKKTFLLYLSCLTRQGVRGCNRRAWRQNLWCSPSPPSSAIIWPPVFQGYSLFLLGIPKVCRRRGEGGLASRWPLPWLCDIFLGFIASGGGKRGVRGGARAGDGEGELQAPEGGTAVPAAAGARDALLDPRPHRGHKVGRYIPRPPSPWSLAPPAGWEDLRRLHRRD